MVKCSKRYKLAPAVAFIFTALFVCCAGICGVSAIDEISLGDVYTNALYESIGGVTIAGNENDWKNTKTMETISFTPETGTIKYSILDSATSEATSLRQGTYAKIIADKSYTINVKYPTVPVSGSIYNNAESTTPIGNLIGGTVKIVNNTLSNKFTITAPRQLGELICYGLSLRNPNPDDISFMLVPGIIPKDYADIIIDESDQNTLKFTITKSAPFELGIWEVQSIFRNSHDDGFSSSAPNLMYGIPYTFTIIADSPFLMISAPVDTINLSEELVVTLKAHYHGDEFKVVVDNGIILPNQENVDIIAGTEGKEAMVHVDSDEILDFVVKPDIDDGEIDGGHRYSTMYISLYENGIRERLLIIRINLISSDTSETSSVTAAPTSTAVSTSTPTLTPTPTVVPTSTPVVISTTETPESIVTPIQTPTVSPTDAIPIPTIKSTKSTPVPTQKSPAPVFGLVAGLGIAVILLRMRR